MKISLILPCYNEEVNLQKGVLDKIGNYVKNDTQFSEVIIVDDGSDDKSREIIKQKYLPQFLQFKLIENPHQGKAASVITGIQKAKNPYVIFSDFDLATPIEESEKLIAEAKKGYPIVIGSRNTTRKGAPFLRKLMAVGFVTIRDLLMGLSGIKDTQCGFKLFEKKAALDIFGKLWVFGDGRKARGSSVSAGFDLEFLYVAQRSGYKIKEVPVIWRHVETKNVNFVKDSLETVRDIIKIKYFALTGKYNTA
ncbi:glycosyltransferase [Candidatus Roizmanbacteria bacterium]|nr:glycosyltransferase [Candidatus Roizmanbacteria bacterium]